eukprot:CAMPEP_0182584844 /NCGR_PEP_ID=MMETSP1324-20130603/58857_1 /TAXON_ID=236786 /ORGANISM="Florenciella sp., Strain RCC1587" /LENGTH=42 /DNA_ID= /DNA_START= /DNA_END= /DNA_ORIENTATION=
MMALRTTRLRRQRMVGIDSEGMPDRGRGGAGGEGTLAHVPVS